MVKTLRITGFIVAVLAVILFTFPVFFGVRNNEQMEQLLKSPGVVEEFNRSKVDEARKGKSEVPPLVKQAQLFAFYLNPPQPKTENIPPGGVKPLPRGPVTPQFTLIGTSFFQARPEMSMAFIDEPGKGPRWVRPSSQVGHLMIEQIKDGLIVVRDGQKTFEIATEKLPEKSILIEGSLPLNTDSGTTLPTESEVSETILRSTASKPLSAEENEALEKLVDTLKKLQKDTKSDKADTDDTGMMGMAVSSEGGTATTMDGINFDVAAARVSDEEANKLGNLGEDLNDVKLGTKEGGNLEYNQKEVEKKKLEKPGRATFLRKK
jgi:hypothetical protein